MDNGFELLVEKEEMWAKMLIEVLEDNSIPCIAAPVHGAGLVLRTGISERLKVYVPADRLSQAAELLRDLFSSDSIRA